MPWQNHFIYCFVWLFNYAVGIQIINYEFEEMGKEAVMPLWFASYTLIAVLPLHLAGHTEENHE
jgi:hypothetical protein